MLHNLLGDGLSAEVLSSVYLWFLPLVPLALAAWLVWSRNLGFGYWFATSQCIAWTLGTVSYYALPTLGPGFQHPWLYADDRRHRRRAADELAGQQPGLGGQHQRAVAERHRSLVGAPASPACTSRSRCWWR